MSDALEAFKEVVAIMTGHKRVEQALADKGASHKIPVFRNDNFKLAISTAFAGAALGSLAGLGLDMAGLKFNMAGMGNIGSGLALGLIAAPLIVNNIMTSRTARQIESLVRVPRP